MNEIMGMFAGLYFVASITYQLGVWLRGKQARQIEALEEQLGFAITQRDDEIHTRKQATRTLVHSLELEKVVEDLQILKDEEESRGYDNTEHLEMVSAIYKWLNTDDKTSKMTLDDIYNKISGIEKSSNARHSQVIKNIQQERKDLLPEFQSLSDRFHSGQLDFYDLIKERFETINTKIEDAFSTQQKFIEEMFAENHKTNFERSKNHEDWLHRKFEVIRLRLEKYNDELQNLKEGFVSNTDVLVGVASKMGEPFKHADVLNELLDRSIDDRHRLQHIISQTENIYKIVNANLFDQEEKTNLPDIQNFICEISKVQNVLNAMRVRQKISFDLQKLQTTSTILKVVKVSAHWKCDKCQFVEVLNELVCSNCDTSKFQSGIEILQRQTNLPIKNILTTCDIKDVSKNE